MTFEARVKTVDAIECADLVDCRAERFKVDWSRFSGGSQVSTRGFFLKQNRQTK